MNIDEILNQLALEHAKKALASALSQVDMLMGQLEPYLSADVLESLRLSFEAQIKRDLGGE